MMSYSKLKSTTPSDLNPGIDPYSPKTLTQDQAKLASAAGVDLKTVQRGQRPADDPEAATTFLAKNKDGHDVEVSTVRDDRFVVVSEDNHKVQIRVTAEQNGLISTDIVADHQMYSAKTVGKATTFSQTTIGDKGSRHAIPADETPSRLKAIQADAVKAFTPHARTNHALHSQECQAPATKQKTSKNDVNQAIRDANILLQ